MRYLLTLLIIANCAFSYSQSNSNSLLGIRAGYSTKGLCAGITVNTNRIFRIKSAKFVTELSGTYFDKKYHFNYGPNWQGGGGQILMKGMIFPGDIDLMDCMIHIEEKYFIRERYFISLIAGVQFNRVSSSQLSQSQFKNTQVYVLAYTYDDIPPFETTVQQVGNTVHNTQLSLWSPDFGIGCGEKFGKHIQLSASFIYSPVEFSSSNSIFGKTLGTGGIENPYYINLHVSANAMIAYTFL